MNRSQQQSQQEGSAAAAASGRLSSSCSSSSSSRERERGVRGEGREGKREESPSYRMCVCTLLFLTAINADQSRILRTDRMLHVISEQ